MWLNGAFVRWDRTRACTLRTFRAAVPALLMRPDAGPDLPKVRTRVPCLGGANHDGGTGPARIAGTGAADAPQMNIKRFMPALRWPRMALRGHATRTCQATP